MKIERAWLRIIVSVIVGGIAGFSLLLVVQELDNRGGPTTKTGLMGTFICSIFVMAPLVTGVLMHLLTPPELKDGHTRCGKCGYILKGLTEPRCSECGEKI